MRLCNRCRRQIEVDPIGWTKNRAHCMGPLSGLLALKVIALSLARGLLYLARAFAGDPVDQLLVLRAGDLEPGLACLAISPLISHY